MRITIESTTQIVELGTGGRGLVLARIWEGTTESGLPVHCFVTRIAAPKDLAGQDLEQFQRELEEQRAPSPAIDGVYPARMIL